MLFTGQTLKSKSNMRKHPYSFQSHQGKLLASEVGPVDAAFESLGKEVNELLFMINYALIGHCERLWNRVSGWDTASYSIMVRGPCLGVISALMFWKTMLHALVCLSSTWACHVTIISCAKDAHMHKNYKTCHTSGLRKPNLADAAFIKPLPYSESAKAHLLNLSVMSLLLRLKR